MKIGFKNSRVVIYALFIFLLLILTSNMAFAKPIIKAYYNGHEATVEGVTLKVDEPFDIDLNITPDQDSIVSVILMEPGVDRSYKRLDGNITYDFIDLRCKSGETCHFHWVLAANGEWTDGTAPVNIYYQLNDAKHGSSILHSGEFTVVNAYISPEHYTSVRSKSTEQASKLAMCQEITPMALLAAFLIARKRL